MAAMESLKLILAMLLVNTSIGVMNVMFKLAKDENMNLSVLMAYRYVSASIVMVPFAWIYERNTRPTMTWSICWRGFCCGFFGSALGQNLFAESVILTSATFATAMMNLIPATTLVLAILLRKEKLAIQSAGGKAKLLGTLICVGGAMILTLYQGVELVLWDTNINLLHHKEAASSSHKSAGGQVLGSVLALLSCLSTSIWFIIQGKLSQLYPSYSITALLSLSAAVPSVVYALCVEQDWSAWQLGWNVKLLYVGYSGLWVGGVVSAMVVWASKLRGPLFVSAFYPVISVTVAFLSSLFLDDHLHLGSIIGALLIVVGLYGILWGKAQEENEAASQNSKEERSTEEERSTVGPTS